MLEMRETWDKFTQVTFENLVKTWKKSETEEI